MAFRNKKSIDIEIAKIAGIPVRINASWIIIFLLVLFSLITSDLPALYPEGNLLIWSLQGIFIVPVFFATLLAHEGAHSLVARKKGIRVSDITLYIFGGAAKILKEPEKPLDEIMMAISGPLTSALLALLFFIFYAAFERLSGAVAVVFYVLAYANSGITIFNLLPAFPLDGGRILRSVLWLIKKNKIRATKLAAKISKSIAVVLFFSGMYSGFFLYTESLWLSFIAVLVFLFSDRSVAASVQSEFLSKRLDEVIGADELKSIAVTPYYNHPGRTLRSIEIRDSDILFDIIEIIRAKNPDLIAIQIGSEFIEVSSYSIYHLILNKLEKFAEEPG